MLPARGDGAEIDDMRARLARAVDQREADTDERTDALIHHLRRVAVHPTERSWRSAGQLQCVIDDVGGEDAGEHAAHHAADAMHAEQIGRAHV